MLHFDGHRRAAFLFGSSNSRLALDLPGLTQRNNPGGENNLFGLRRSLLHGGYTYTLRRSSSVLRPRIRIHRVITSTICQVGALLFETKVNLSKLTVVVLVGRRVRKRVIVRALIHSGLNRALYTVGIVEGLAARIGSNLFHGSLFAGDCLPEFTGFSFHP